MKNMLAKKLEELLNRTTETMHCVRISVRDLEDLLEDRRLVYHNLKETQELCNQQLFKIRRLTGGDGSNPELKSVLARANELELSEQELDEMVHELKSQEASGINNGGRDEQLAYLLEVLGERELFRQLESL
jgi:hypothetical protein